MEVEGRDEKTSYWTWLLPLLLASGPYAFFGADHPLLTFVPMGPMVVAWTLLSPKMNGWNRTGAALGIGWLSMLIWVLINTGLQAANHQKLMLGSWMAVPLSILLLIAARKSRQNIGPAFKLIVIFAVIVLVGGMYETIYMRAVSKSLQGEGMSRLNLLGLLVTKAMYVPPHALLYSVSLWYARRAAPTVSVAARPQTEEKTAA